MDVFAPHLCVQRPEEDIKFFGTGVRDASELPRECWEVNLDPLPEQPVLSSAEPPAASHLDFSGGTMFPDSAAMCADHSHLGLAYCNQRMAETDSLHS